MMKKVKAIAKKEPINKENLEKVNLEELLPELALSCCGKNIVVK